jgi:hypothetical protein
MKRRLGGVKPNKERDYEMKRTLLTLVAATTLAAGIPAVASAQSIDQRFNNISRGISESVRAGGLTQYEADRLINELRQIQRIDADYRRGGLSDWERRDLNQRLDRLVRAYDSERRDGQRAPARLYERVNTLQNNIRTGYQNGGLTDREASSLQRDLDQIRYRIDRESQSRNGLSDYARQDLNRQIDRLAEVIRREQRDNERRGRYDDRYGYGYGSGYGGNYGYGGAYGYPSNPYAIADLIGDLFGN